MSIIKFTFMILGLATLASAGKCYVLSMEGGGTRGAYEAGAFLAMTQYLPASETSYDFLTGISIGSVNSCWSVGFEKGDERNMALHLNETWWNLQPMKIQTPNLFPLFFHAAVFNTKNLYKAIVQYSGDTIRRNISVSATNYNTGQLTQFTESLGISDLAMACWASTAYPGVYPPVYFQDQYWADGCVTLNSNPYAGTERCNELGYSNDDIVLDILSDWPPSPPPPQRVNNTRQMMSRIVTLRKIAQGYWYLLAIREDFHPRYYVIPSENMPELATRNSQLRDEIALGYKDAVNTLQMSQQERKEATKNRMKSLKSVFHSPHF